MPIRIQRKRTKGFRLPPNCVYVGRPSRWGNPYDWRKASPDAGPAAWARGVAVDLFRDHAHALQSMVDEIRRDKARGFSWDRFTSGVKWLDGTLERERMVDVVSACEHGVLRGKHLACWCYLCPDHMQGRPIGVRCEHCHPCHADVLLEIANR